MVLFSEGAEVLVEGLGLVSVVEVDLLLPALRDIEAYVLQKLYELLVVGELLQTPLLGDLVTLRMGRVGVQVPIAAQR